MDECWGEEGKPVEDWAKKIVAWGPRQSYEMEQVLPIDDTDDPDGDPIVRSNDLKSAGHFTEASRILMELCNVDLRCFDAHSHLDNMVFEDVPQRWAWRSCRGPTFCSSGLACLIPGWKKRSMSRLCCGASPEWILAELRRRT
jgi:hypothetical protein